MTCTALIFFLGSLERTSQPEDTHMHIFPIEVEVENSYQTQNRTLQYGLDL